MTIEYALIAIATATLVVAKLSRTKYRHEFIVNEGYSGLLHHHGKLVASLAPGRYVRWGRNYRVALVDMRRTLLPVAGQEVLSSDNVGVKLSIVLTLQIADAAKSSQLTDSHTAHVYSAAQTAVRTLVAGMTMEALLTQRMTLGEQLREMLSPQAEAIGLQIHAAEVRDVMLPAELRRAFSETLKARQEGQAALERTRGETAALRSLANAARLLEGQPGLATLRLLQTLENPGTARTVVLNDLATLFPALHTRAGQTAASAPEASL